MDIPIPDDWEGDYCCYSIQWPESKQYLAILRGLISSAADGRFYLASSGSIIGAQQIIRETFDHNFAHEEVLMSCNTETAAALQAIAAAIAGQSSGAAASNCCGGGTAGGTQFPPAPGGVDTGGSNPGTDDPPDGYDSWEQFETQRCGVANQILDDLQSSLGNIILIEITGLDLEAILAVMITLITLTISTAGLAAIGALLLTVGSTIIVASALDLVTTHRDELICALLSGTSSQTSRLAFINKFNELADDASIDVVETFAMKQLISYMVGNEETNRMYTPNSSIDYSGYTCPDCVPCCFDWAVTGDDMGWISTNTGGATSLPTSGTAGQSTDDGGVFKLELQFSADDDFYSGGVKSPLMNCPITAETVLCRNISDATGGSFNNYITIITNLGATDLIPGETSSPIGVNTFSLADYDGQTLLGIWFGFSRGDADTFVNVAKCGVCDDCNEV